MRNGALLGAIILTGLTGCVAPGAETDEEFRSHDDLEVTVSFEELMAGWTQEGEWMVSPPLEVPEGASRVGVSKLPSSARQKASSSAVGCRSSQARYSAYGSPERRLGVSPRPSAS